MENLERSGKSLPVSKREYYETLVAKYKQTVEASVGDILIDENDSRVTLYAHTKIPFNSSFFPDLSSVPGLVGVLDYRVGGDVLQVIHREISTNFRGKGLGTLVLAQALATNPSIKTIIGELTRTNEAVLRQGQAGTTSQEPFKQTPFSKTCTQLGFTLQKLDNSGKLPKLIASLPPPPQKLT